MWVGCRCRDGLGDSAPPAPAALPGSNGSKGQRCGQHHSTGAGGSGAPDATAPPPSSLARTGDRCTHHLPESELCRDVALAEEQVGVRAGFDVHHSALLPLQRDRRAKWDLRFELSRRGVDRPLLGRACNHRPPSRAHSWGRWQRGDRAGGDCRPMAHRAPRTTQPRPPCSRLPATQQSTGRLSRRHKSARATNETRGGEARQMEWKMEDGDRRGGLSRRVGAADALPARSAQAPQPVSSGSSKPAGSGCSSPSLTAGPSKHPNTTTRPRRPAACSTTTACTSRKGRSRRSGSA